MLYTISLVALLLGVVLAVITVMMFFSWNVRKLRRDVKGISRSTLSNNATVMSVDNYIKLSEANFQESLELSDFSPSTFEPSEEQEDVKETEPAEPVEQGIDDKTPEPVAVRKPKHAKVEELEECPTTMLSETKDVDEESETGLLEDVQGTVVEEVDDSFKILKPISTYRSWSD